MRAAADAVLVGGAVRGVDGGARGLRRRGPQRLRNRLAQVGRPRQVPPRPPPHPAPELKQALRHDRAAGAGRAGRAMNVLRAEVAGLAFSAHDPRVYFAAGLDSQAPAPLAPPTP